MTELNDALRVARATDPELHAAYQRLIGSAVMTLCFGLTIGVCLSVLVWWLWT